MRSATMIRRFRSFPPSTCLVGRRWLSRKQISTALRPFYFLVHPDLLSKFPEERAVNETSLKSLKSHLNVILDEGRSPAPLEVRFFLKPRSQSRRRPQLRSVKVSFHDTVRKTVVSILRGCGLPTSYVDSIQETLKDNISSPFPAFYDLDEPEPSPSKKLHSTDVNQPLSAWLTKNVELARSRLFKSEPIRLSIEKRRDEICSMMGLRDILFDPDSGWETGHQNGTLASFQNMCEHHYDSLKAVLPGRTVVFGNHGSGVSRDGKIILYSGEVRYNWLHVIKNVPEGEKQLEQIPLVEKALSQSLRDVTVARRKNQPLTLVDEHRSRLMKLVTNINDYLSRQSLPKTWPGSLAHLQLCVETESCPLMLLPSGEFAVPASCPGFVLVKYITDHMHEAEQRLADAKLSTAKEDVLATRCINELGLIQLDREPFLDGGIECLERLLSSAPSVRHLTHGNHVMVTRYYSVLSDGVICIPWNWKE